MTSYNPEVAAKLSVMISAEQIRNRIREMAQEIDSTSGPGPLYLISVLKGSFVFLADLARAIKKPVRIEFMAISSYGKDKTTSGQVKVLKDLDVSIEGRDLLIVEDIIDSGVTLNYLLRLFEQRRPQSIRIATLLDKPDRRIQPVKVDYIGFAIPDKFVVGYGLDDAEDYRNLPDICVLSE
jgi:hypoxanthine phosphoribosyltransferase